MVVERMLESKSIILAVIVLFFAFCTWTVIWNTYFHPLARFPGPWLNAVTYLTDLIIQYRGGGHRYIKKLHDRYGSVVRIAPDSLSFNTSQAARDIYGSRVNARQIPKDPKFYGEPENFPVANIIECDIADHSRIRRHLSHAFSEAALREQEPFLTRYFDLLVLRLRDQIASPKVAGKVDLVRWYNFLTFDIIGDLCFGEPFGALVKGEYHYWISNIATLLQFGRVLAFGWRYRWIGALIGYVMAFFPRFGKAFKKHSEYGERKTVKRIDSDTQRTDIMSYVLRHNTSDGMTRQEIVAAGTALILAGSETTAGALSAATYFLLTHPAALQRARSEVRGAFKQASDITLYSTTRLTFLLAVLEEALRMYPPVPVRLPRRTNPSQSDVIDGHVIPGDTSIGAHQWATNRSAANFTDPDAFVPERWLNPPPARYARDDRSALQPFSQGPRNCLGKNLARSELRSVMARMLWNFDMELCTESSDFMTQDVKTLWEKPPLMVRLAERKILDKD